MKQGGGGAAAGDAMVSGLIAETSVGRPDDRPTVTCRRTCDGGQRSNGDDTTAATKQIYQPKSRFVVELGGLYIVRF